jgi:hypothetical protein|tara:strand:+ start:68 stop:457 length:390 start_codon:yes stop_codon:yes gene_type:complete
MRVKLSYTVGAEDVLKEAAKLIGLQGEDMQVAVSLYNDVQKELKGENDEETGVVNINRAQEMLTEFREALFIIDRRLDEVAEIINGYDDYLRSARVATEAPDLYRSQDEEVMTALSEDVYEEPELFGAD